MGDNPADANPVEAAPARRPTPLAPRFDAEPPSWPKVFVSNLKDFLTERPVKLTPHSARVFSDMRFGGGFGENLKEFFRSGPAARRLGNSDLLLAWKPWYRLFWENLRDSVAPPKLPPLKLTSQPVKVRELWSSNKQFTRVQVMSLLWHTVLAILILVPLWPKLVQQAPVQASKTEIVPLDISPYLAQLPPGKDKAGGGGGGGERNPVPASRGRLPKFSWTQYTPPAVKIPVKPKLQMPASVLGPPDIHLPSPNMPNYGDPLAKLITDSGGSGGGSGIGTGCCGGVGSGEGGGVGPGYGYGTGGGYPGAGRNGYGEPECIYCPHPTFSDEAVKAKYQGSVLVRAIVTPDGRAANIEIVKGAGLGLDERAVEAVRTWRFKPALGPNGKPAAVSIVIEVEFRLL